VMPNSQSSSDPSGKGAPSVASGGGGSRSGGGTKGVSGFGVFEADKDKERQERLLAAKQVAG
jgi:hypothetical protein